MSSFLKGYTVYENWQIGYFSAMMRAMIVKNPDVFMKYRLANLC
jgi:hypothetical protein